MHFYTIYKQNLGFEGGDQDPQIIEGGDHIPFLPSPLCTPRDTQFTFFLILLQTETDIGNINAQLYLFGNQGNFFKVYEFEISTALL